MTNSFYSENPNCYLILLLPDKDFFNESNIEGKIFSFLLLKVCVCMCIAGKVTDRNFINSNLIEKSIFSLFFCNLNAGAVKCQLPKKHSLKDQQFSRIGESYNLKKYFLI